MSNGLLSSKAPTFALMAVVVIVLAVAGSMYVLENLKGDDDADLVVVSYQSFSSWGLGPWAEENFEEMYGLEVEIDTSYGDIGELIGALGRGDVDGDVIVGIDNSMLSKALDMDLLETYRPENITEVDPGMVFDPQFHVVPYDYGYIAMICNSDMMEDRNLPYPSSIMNLSEEIYKDQLMLLDPSMTSTGASFLIWAASMAGDNLDDYLEGLSSNQFNVFQSWDLMYSAFQSGEAPIAISYGLDTASDIYYSGSSTTVTIVPENEGYRQIEGAGILKNAGNREYAELFIDFLISEGFQSKVGYNVMLPVVPSAYVEPVFLEHGEFAEEHVEPGMEEIQDNFDDWMASWEDAFY